MMSGGSLAIRRSPSTSWGSLSNALMLSFDRALATLRSNCLRCFAVTSRLIRAAMSSTSRRVYQRSKVRMPAKLAIGLAIGARDGDVDRLSVLGAEAAIAAGHGKAGDEPLDVPLEWTGKRLVEVVDA